MHPPACAGWIRCNTPAIQNQEGGGIEVVEKAGGISKADLSLPKTRTSGGADYGEKVIADEGEQMLSKEGGRLDG